MKLFPILLLTVSTLAFSQEPNIITLMKPLKCTTIENVIQFLKQYDEKLFWLGRDNLLDSTQIALYKNEESGTWTLIQFDNKIGCVLGVGNLGKQV